MTPNCGWRSAPAGDKFFSAGWDLKAAADGDAVDGDYGVGGFAGLRSCAT